MEDSITYDEQGHARSFVGPRAVDVFAMAVMVSALRLYAKTGIRANRAYTPKAMIECATRWTGHKFKARDYEGAARALEQKITEEKVKLQHLPVQVTPQSNPEGL